MIPKFFKAISKDGLTPLKMERILMLITGVCLLIFADKYYKTFVPVLQLIFLILYLSLLVGISPLPLPVFKRKFLQVGYFGIGSGAVDSYILLDQGRSLRTVEAGQNEEEVIAAKKNQEVEGVRAKLMVLLTLAALIGGLILWWGEAYAAGLYNNNDRTNLLSALFIVPPVIIFLSVLGIHAELLPIKVVRNQHVKLNIRDLCEFIAGIIALLLTHNPLWCIGLLLIYAVLTSQDNRLFRTWEHHTEWNVMFVLLIALIAGPWLVENVVNRLGWGTGEYKPIIVAAIQAVLWGPLYDDPTVHFWMKITTLSTGAILFPPSNLVGVMLFKQPFQWKAYMRYSFPYAIFWYFLMRTWIYLVLDTPVGRFLEQWAHAGGSH